MTNVTDQAADGKGRSPSHRPLVVIGLVITFLWCAAVVAICFVTPSNLRELTLNEWGDFLSGMVAPIVLVWLVLGYFLQARELQNQIKETAQIARASSAQAALLKEQLQFNISRAEEAAKPRFILNQFRPGLRGTAYLALWDLVYIGPQVKVERVTTPGLDCQVDLGNPSLKQGDKARWFVRSGRGALPEFPEQFTLKVEAVTSEGQSSQVIDCDLKGKFEVRGDQSLPPPKKGN